MMVVPAVTVSHTLLPGVLLIEPQVYGDERGFFMETWNQRRYVELGITEPFVQDNLSFSRYGVLRGLHFQHPNDQGKLVYVLQGEVFDVAVDIRRGSPTFGRWTGITLSWGNKKQLYIPPGFAHGFALPARRPCSLTNARNSTTLPPKAAWPGTIPILASTGRFLIPDARLKTSRVSNSRIFPVNVCRYLGVVSAMLARGNEPRILLLGANGQVGWELQHCLMTLGEVIAIGRNTEPLSVDLADPSARKNSLLDNSRIERTFGIHRPAWDEALSLCLAGKS